MALTVAVLGIALWPAVPGRAEHLTTAALQGSGASSETDAVAQGRILFLRYCAFCHGPSGRGNGLPAAGMSPPPADLGSYQMRRMSDAQLLVVISGGEKGTAMPAFVTILTAQQRQAVLAYIRDELQPS